MIFTGWPRSVIKFYVRSTYTHSYKAMRRLRKHTRCDFRTHAQLDAPSVMCSCANKTCHMKGIFLIAGVLDCQCGYCCGYACIAIQWPLQTQLCSCVSQVYNTARIPHTRNRWEHFIDSPSNCSHSHSTYMQSHCTNTCPAVPISTTIPVKDRDLSIFFNQFVHFTMQIAITCTIYFNSGW